MREIASRTGGRILNGDETGLDIFPEERQPRRSSSPIADLFLAALAILLPLDVAMRRIQLDKEVLLGLLRGRGRGKPDATLDALLRRKRAVETTIEQGRTRATPRPQTAPRVTTSPKEPSVVEAPPAPAAEKPGEGLTTTGRLLAAKKKWKKEGEDRGKSG